jgi:hypothetical protein
MEKKYEADTNILLPMEDWYYKQPLFSYWISSSHNTYLSHDQLRERSTLCYYRLQLMFYYGGCVEIDTYSVKDNDIIIQHLPSNSGGITLTSILDLVIKVTNIKINNNIVSSGGPIILTFDNKNLKKKSEHDVFWNIIKTYNLKDKQNYFLDITDDLDLTTKPLFDYNNKILIRWGQNDYKKCKDVNHSQNIGTELCPPNNSNIPEFIRNKINPSKWVHLPKTKFNFTKSILNDVENKSISVQIKDGKKFINPNINVISNTFNNIMRVYPSYKNVLSGNYINNMIYFAMGVQIVALNLQTLNQSWFFNKAIFMPPNGKPCVNSNIENEKENCHKDKYQTDKYKLAPSWIYGKNPLAYRLKPLWLLGLRHYPKPYDLELKFVFDNKYINKTNFKFKVKYCLDHNKYNKDIKFERSIQNIVSGKFLRIDPTMPVFYIKFEIDGKTYKNGFEISWDKNNLSGKINIDSYSLSKHNKSDKYNKSNTNLDNQSDKKSGKFLNIVSKIASKVSSKVSSSLTSSNYNDVKLDDQNISKDCFDDTLFNFDEVIPLTIEYKWSDNPLYDISDDLKNYNKAITKTRDMFYNKDDLYFLNDINAFKSYKQKLLTELVNNKDNKHEEFSEDEDENKEEIDDDVYKIMI